MDKIPTWEESEPIEERIPTWEESEPIELRSPSFLKGIREGIIDENTSPSGLDLQDLGRVAGKYALPTGISLLGFPDPLTMGVGYAAGESIRRAAKEYFTQGKEGVNILGSAGGPVYEGFIQYAGGKFLPKLGMALKESSAGQAVGKGAKWAGRKLVTLGENITSNIIKPFVSSLSGVPEEILSRIYLRPSEIVKYIGQTGKDVSEAGKLFVAAIENNKQKIGEAYADIIKSVLSNPDYKKFIPNPHLGGSQLLSPANVDYSPITGGMLPNFKSDLQKGMMETLSEVKKDFGYGLPNRIVSPEDANVFNRVSDIIMSKLKTPSGEDLYYLQRDLTGMMSQYEGKPLGAAFRKIKNKLMGYLGEKIPKIGEANKIYAEGKELLSELAGLSRADNPSSIIKSASKKFTNTWDAMLDIGDKYAGTRQILEQFLDKEAGAAITPLIRKLPPTGFTSGGLVGAGYAIGAQNPAMLAVLGATAPFLSPRFTGLAARAASKLATDILPSGKSAIATSAKRLTPIIGGISGSQSLRSLYEQYLSKK